MKLGFSYAGMIINIFLYKSMGSLLSFYRYFLGIFIDLFDENEKLQNIKL